MRMNNDSNTIKLEFYKFSDYIWKSHYKLDQAHFYIHHMRHNYLLHVPKRFLIQFKDGRTDPYFRTATYEEAEQLAQLIFRGKAGEIKF